MRVCRMCCFFASDIIVVFLQPVIRFLHSSYFSPFLVFYDMFAKSRKKPKRNETKRKQFFLLFKDELTFLLLGHSVINTVIPTKFNRILLEQSRSVSNEFIVLRPGDPL